MDEEEEVPDIGGTVREDGVEDADVEEEPLVEDVTDDELEDALEEVAAVVAAVVAANDRLIMCHIMF